MLSVGRSLKEHGCSFLHVTCKVHALHLVAETIRNFSRSRRININISTQCPGVSEPPQPIVTRWGTWLEAAFYYAKYFTQIKSVLLQFNPKEAAAIKEIQMTFHNSSLERDLKTIHDNYIGLHAAITRFEDTALPLAQSLQIVDDVNTLLQTISDSINENVREKCDRVLKTNPDFITLRQIYDGVSTVPFSECRDLFNYACITSVDVEQSFSKYKHIFSSRRTSVLDTTVETYLMVQK
ncbi:hypothetical protein NQ318_005899 [Aromia moschata]|uniref:HAT C-terminal dimerisation domain-containing protein n=1 Tax=Aromia moschata TaxID=1265417 RepID=A0AAV8YSD0_9CUCU|nr:hypothetical protein NQ318_005899 [Aromia moschata]